MAFPTTVAGALAQNGTPDSNPTESVPTESTAPEPPEVPVESTATDVPVQTATTETESEFDSAIAAEEVNVEFLVCADDDWIDEGELQFGGGEFEAAETAIQCRPADGVTITFTDVNGVFGPYDVETGETYMSFNALIPVVLVVLGAVPAGTYTLTEVFIGATRVSDPFEIMPDGGDSSVIVRNHTSEDEPEFEGEGSTLLLWAYDCVNDAKAGTSEFYYNPGIIGDAFDEGFPFPGGEIPLIETSDFSAASTESCVPAE